MKNLFITDLMSFFEKHYIINNHQFGFQKGKARDHAILDIYSKIITSIEKDQSLLYFPKF